MFWQRHVTGLNDRIRTIPEFSCIKITTLPIRKPHGQNAVSFTFFTTADNPLFHIIYLFIQSFIYGLFKNMCNSEQ
jgi:hypothetical protein